MPAALYRRSALILGVILTSVGLQLCLATGADAYALYPCKFGPGAVYVGTSAAVPSALKTATSSATEKWHASTSEISVYYQAPPVSNLNRIHVATTTTYASTTWAAVPLDCPQPTAHAGHWNGKRADMYWNLPSSTTGANTLTSAFQRTQGGIHEIGHALGLAHVGVRDGLCNSPKAVMRQATSKFTCGWGYGPYTDDVNGVKAIYS